MTDIKLKPCPFCGSTTIYETFERGYFDDSAIIFCNDCKVSVKLESNDQEGYTKETKRKAVEAWNRRTERKRGELIRCKDCDWWTKQEASLQGRCALMGMYPTGGWYCGNAKSRGDQND